MRKSTIVIFAAKIESLERYRVAQGFESNAISVAIAFFIAEKKKFGLPLHCPLPKILFSHCRCIARFLGNAIYDEHFPKIKI